MSLPSFSVYVADLRGKLLDTIDQPVKKIRDMRDFSYSFLDNNLGQYWDFCIGLEARPEDLAENQKRFKQMRLEYEDKLRELLANTNANCYEARIQKDIDLEIAALYYFLYKFDSMLEAEVMAEDLAINGAKNNDNLELLWQQQSATSKFKFNDCFTGNKTLHVVQVLDGTGDLVHFANWLKEYCLRYDIANTTAIIICGPMSNRESVQEYIDNLDPKHPLNSHPDLIICRSNESQHVIYGTLFKSVVNRDFNNNYRALYSISTPFSIDKNNLLKLPQLGLPTCLINEMGTEVLRTNNMLEDFYEFSFGIGNNPIIKPIGFFFPKVQPVELLATIVTRLSDNLKEKLFGRDALQWSQATLLAKIQGTKIICGYYSPGRDLNVVNTLLEKIKNQNTILFFTGLDDLRYHDYEIPKGTKNLRVVCGVLNKNDYNDLIQLIRTDNKYWLFCSGDNSFIQSIAYGKLPLFLHRKNVSQRKQAAIQNFINVLEDISKHTTMINRGYIAEIIKFLRNPSYNLPMPDALDFFAAQISPYICESYDLAKNFAELVINVENNFHEEFKPRVEPFVERAKTNGKNFTPMFVIRHYEQTQTELKTPDIIKRPYL